MKCFKRAKNLFTDDGAAAGSGSCGGRETALGVAALGVAALGVVCLLWCEWEIIRKKGRVKSL